MSRAILGFVLVVCALCFVWSNLNSQIVYVTAVPTSDDSMTTFSSFGNHLADTRSAPRGGDLMIRYPNGTSRALTAEAGFGSADFQGTNSIAVRDPSFSTNGTKIYFSMVVGSPLQANSTEQFYWQLYACENFAINAIPEIRKVLGQPLNANNICPVTNSKDELFFISDYTSTAIEYPRLDEVNSKPATTGIYKIEITDLNVGLHIVKVLEATSGVYNLSISNNDVLSFNKLDGLQRDRLADVSLSSGTNVSAIDFSSQEPAGRSASDHFPEPLPNSADLTGTEWNGHSYDMLLPWVSRDDGHGLTTIFHIGRHELLNQVLPSLSNDTSLKTRTTSRPSAVTLLTGQTGTGGEIRTLINNRNPKKHSLPRLSAWVNAPRMGSHSSGQILNDGGSNGTSVFTTLTNGYTYRPTAVPDTSKANYGFYRDVVFDGSTQAGWCVHSSCRTLDLPTTASDTLNSGFDFRLKQFLEGTLARSSKSSPNFDSLVLVTTGTTKTVQYFQGGRIRYYSGVLWELQPVSPNQSLGLSPPIVSPIVSDTVAVSAIALKYGFDTPSLLRYMNDSSLALLHMSDVIKRHDSDRQQPFNLLAHNAKVNKTNAKRKIYDVSFVEVLQSEPTRGYKKSGSVVAGRRIRAVRKTLPSQSDFGADAPSGMLKVQRDGSAAGFVPACQSLTWQTVDSNKKAVVRERIWMSLGKQEIRTCGQCHGNTIASTSNSYYGDPRAGIAAGVQSDALDTLLKRWHKRWIPDNTRLVVPGNDEPDFILPKTFSWIPVPKALKYKLVFNVEKIGREKLDYRNSVVTTSTNYADLQIDPKYLPAILTVDIYSIGEYVTNLKAETKQFIVQPDFRTTLLRFPTDYEIVTGDEAIFSWAPYPFANSYVFELSPDADFTRRIVSTEVGELSYRAKKLERGTRYFWRVKPISDSKTTNFTNTWSFLVAKSWLQSATLFAPQNFELDVVNPTIFSWSEVDSAESYVLEIGTDRSFQNSKTFDCSTNGATATLDYGNTYFWRVHAKRPEIDGQMSAINTFSTKTETTSGIDYEFFSQLTVSPNPASRELRLLSKNGFMIDSGSLNTLDGQKVHSWQEAAPTSDAVLSLDSVPSGTYLLIVNGNGRSVKRLITVSR